MRNYLYNNWYIIYIYKLLYISIYIYIYINVTNKYIFNAKHIQDVFVKCENIAEALEKFKSYNLFSCGVVSFSKIASLVFWILFFGFLFFWFPSPPNILLRNMTSVCVSTNYIFLTFEWGEMWIAGAGIARLAHPLLFGVQGALWRPITYSICGVAAIRVVSGLIQFLNKYWIGTVNKNFKIIYFLI